MPSLKFAQNSKQVFEFNVSESLGVQLSEEALEEAVATCIWDERRTA